MKKIIICVLLLSLAGLAGSFYLYQREKSYLQNVTKTKQAVSYSREALIAKIGELTALPAEEKPLIVYIKDNRIVKQQQFFAKAKVGDIVLIYTNNKRAILYDPVSNSILQDAPVILPSGTPGSRTTEY